MSRAPNTLLDREEFPNQDWSPKSEIPPSTTNHYWDQQRYLAELHSYDFDIITEGKDKLAADAIFGTHGAELLQLIVSKLL